MPAYPIVDTHLHVWDPSNLRYPWLSGAPKINRSLLLEDYRRACGTVGVAKMVFVQCECDPAQFLDEAAWVSQLAKQDARIRGIVPWAPLELGGWAEEPLARLSADPLVKGIRRIIQFEPDQEFCLKPSFIEGVKLLPRFGLSFDLCINHSQMVNTLKLVRQCPEVNFVLDHIGKPSIRTNELDPWRAHITEFAALPNVWCKLSGLATEADHEHWTPDQFRPYAEHVFSTFGCSRTMFGGDWPVSTQAIAYPRWVETLDSLTGGLSADERKDLYVRTGETFYRV